MDVSKIWAFKKKLFNTLKFIKCKIIKLFFRLYFWHPTKKFNISIKWSKYVIMGIKTSVIYDHEVKALRIKLKVHTFPIGV